MSIRYGLSAVLIGVSIAIVQSQMVHALSARQVDKIAESITVLIEGPIPGFLGSGVIIKQQGKTYTIVTAYHVVKNPGKYSIVTPNQKHHSLDYGTVKQLPGVDMAILTFTSEESYSVAKLGDSTIASRGMNCFVTGFPGTGRALTSPVFTFTEGRLAANGQPQADGYALMYDNQTLPGMSGGAVLNDQGELIGIHGRGVESNAEPSRINADVAVVKTAYNLGIPINTLLTLAPKVDSTIALGAPKTLSRTSKAEDFLIQGVDKSHNNQFKAAIADFDQAIRLNPNYSEAYMSRGLAVMKLVIDPSPAFNDFDQAVRSNPNNAEAYYWRAYSRKTDNSSMEKYQNEFMKTIADYGQAIRLKPDYALAYASRGQILITMDTAGGVADLRKAIELYKAQGNDYAVDENCQIIQARKMDIDINIPECKK
jgi:S1-C subfamily serine protease